jgi:hypothetical protein
MTEIAASPVVEPRQGRAAEVFAVALQLGLTSFGGPIAHLGYFERTYVRERQWLTPGEYGGLVALCHMVPGRASSQVSYLIGLRGAGWSARGNPVDRRSSPCSGDLGHPGPRTSDQERHPIAWRDD